MRIKRLCRINILLLWLVATLTLTTLCSAAPPKTTAQAQVYELLQGQVVAWNRGDLRAFMAGYWNSPQLTFYSGGTVSRGWQPTLERYEKRYGAGHEMGTLTFDQLEVTVFSPGAAMACGQWRLAMSGGKSPHGLFTLFLRKLPEGWRIVHDHSSME